MKLENLSTFIKVRGTLDNRVRASTGLDGTEALLNAMHNKPRKKAVDFLIPSVCNKNCTHCFFQEDQGSGFVQVNDQMIDFLRQQIAALDLNNTNITIYPREITQAMQLLPVYAENGLDRALTNGLLLTNKQVIRQLQKYGIKRLAISLHGFQNAQMMLTGETALQYQQSLEGLKCALTEGFNVSIFSTIFRGNVDDLPKFFDYAYQLGLREINLLRLIPVGNASNLPEEYFLNLDNIENMLYAINAARKKYPALRISLFGSSFGPNFYSPNAFKYLAGQKNTWPNSTYFCPWIEKEFVGLSLGSQKQYPCFKALSFSDNDIDLTSPLGVEDLQSKLQGDCSSDNCQYQKLCLGSCRITAFSFARRSGQPDPLYAGQDFCLTRILDEITK